ncbi:MAG: hypothetical protein AAGJ28_26325, partial [Pseudomonadota bacterium]
MVEIKDSDDLLEWLNSRPKEVRAYDSRLIASRAALRVLPVIWLAKPYMDDFVPALLVPTFRAMAVASFAGTWAKLATEEWRDTADTADTAAAAAAAAAARA